MSTTSFSRYKIWQLLLSEHLARNLTMLQQTKLAVVHHVFQPATPTEASRTVPLMRALPSATQAPEQFAACTSGIASVLLLLIGFPLTKRSTAIPENELELPPAFEHQQQKVAATTVVAAPMSSAACES
jgi:hypothetical protein